MKKQHINNRVSSNNIDDINNNYIMSFIIKNNINYTENNNGFFINLDKIEDDLIDKLYNYINNYININDNYINNINYTHNITYPTKINQVKKYIKPPNLNKTEKNILNYINELFKY